MMCHDDRASLFARRRVVDPVRDVVDESSCAKTPMENNSAVHSNFIPNKLTHVRDPALRH
jgi:hypothetical protein